MARLAPQFGARYYNKPLLSLQPLFLGGSELAPFFYRSPKNSKKREIDGSML